MQFTINLHLVLRLRMGGVSPTFLPRDFTAWTGSTMYLYHFEVPTETAAIQIIYVRTWQRHRVCSNIPLAKQNRHNIR